MQLNENQLKAATFEDGGCCVIAGPGSGKTRVIIERILYLLTVKRVQPEMILVFTFTNKACDEIKKRLKERLGYTPKVTITTFHSFAFKCLLSLFPSKKIRDKVRPITDKEQKQIIRKLLKEYGFKEFQDSVVLKYFKSIKNKYDPNIKDDNDNHRIKIGFLLEKYDAICDENYYIGFDDMVSKLVIFMNQNEDYLLGIADSFKYIMVDECQDMNQIQYELCLLLECVHHNLFIVGDPAQSIYQWRGSDLSLINHFLEHYKAIRIDLNENYRSDAYIVKCTGELIKLNQNRIDIYSKPMRPAVNLPVFKAFSTKKDEARQIVSWVLENFNEGINYQDQVVLFRKHKHAIEIEKEWRRHKLPYSKDAKSFFDEKVIQTIYNYYRLIINTDDNYAFEFVSDKPSCGIQMKKAQQISAEKRISLFEACREINNKNTKAFVQRIEFLKQQMKLIKPLEFYDLLIKTTNIKEYREFTTNEVSEYISSFRELLLSIEGEDIVSATSDFFKNVLFSKIKSGIDEGIRLMTIHQAKGLEAKVVYSIGMVESSGYYDMPNVEEERRISYVCATRAIDKLYCTSYSTDREDEYRNLRPSRFYRELYTSLQTQQIKKKEDASSS